MDYSIYKENKPEETISKIKNILNELDISLKEKITEHKYNKKNVPYSLTIYLSDISEYKAEGKGASLINAKASAYAEFIERVQNGFIFPVRVNDFVFSPDETFIEKTLLLKSETANFISNKKLFNALNNFVNTNRKNIKEKDKVLVIPFYSLKEKQIIQIPILVYEWLAGSNGMAAGNSIEEAIVQGLSEICERYAAKQIIQKRLSMPNIPCEEYLKYTKISEILKLYIENGYQVEIKDASLGFELPVVCAVIHNNNENITTLSFGSHPSLPVAIERCLTEYAQGTDITNKRNKTNNASSIKYNEEYLEKETYEHLINTNNLNFLFEKQFIHRVDIETCKPLQAQLTNQDLNWTYSKNAWINNNIKLDNTALLHFLINKIQKITSEIYIRDVSFLGFPAVRILIPKMSFIFEYDIERIAQAKELINWSKTEYKSEKESICYLFKSLNIRKNTYFHLDSQFSDLPNEYIKFLCAIYLNDIEEIKNLANTIIENNKISNFFKEEFITRICIIKDFYELKSKNKDISNILEHLNSIYKNEDIKKLKIFMKYLSPHIIKLLIKPYNLRKNYQIQYTKNKDKIDKIIFKLAQKHKENIIDQKKLINVFNNI